MARRRLRAATQGPGHGRGLAKGPPRRGAACRAGAGKGVSARARGEITPAHGGPPGRGERVGGGTGRPNGAFGRRALPCVSSPARAFLSPIFGARPTLGAAGGGPVAVIPRRAVSGGLRILGVVVGSTIRAGATRTGVTGPTPTRRCGRTSVIRGLSVAVRLAFLWAPIPFTREG